MNVFIVHSGQDWEQVKNIVNCIDDSTSSFNPMMLENGGALWKMEARKLLKKAQIVIFFVGADSYSSSNISWELNEAIIYKKMLFIVKLEKDNKVPSVLNKKDKFSKKLNVYGKEKNIEELIDIINAHESGKYQVFNNKDINKNKDLLFEQYKLFLETSENLVARRQNVNSFYISVNTAIVSATGIFVNFTSLANNKILICLLASLVGFILSMSWISILDCYGNLNSAKMKILSIIEKDLPASLFDAEWEVLSDKLNNRKYISFTDSEKRIPKLFICIYSALSIGVILYYLYTFR